MADAVAATPPLNFSGSPLATGGSMAGKAPVGDLGKDIAQNFKKAETTGFANSLKLKGAAPADALIGTGKAAETAVKQAGFFQKAASHIGGNKIKYGLGAVAAVALATVVFSGKNKEKALDEKMAGQSHSNGRG